MPKNITILLVDDEPDILEIISYNLKKEGYGVHTAHNGTAALKKASKIKPNLILLDLMLPDMDGVEICENIRNISSLQNTLIAFLTARTEDYSMLAGLGAGADDYITKPVKPKILIEKVKSLLRRLPEEQEDEATTILKIADIEIHLNNYSVSKNGEDFSLPRREFELLYLLAKEPNRVFKREEILGKIWGNEIVVGNRTIDVHIRRLREKIGNGYFQTIKGVGYKFVNTKK